MLIKLWYHTEKWKERTVILTSVVNFNKLESAEFEIHLAKVKWKDESTTDLGMN